MRRIIVKFYFDREIRFIGILLFFIGWIPAIIVEGLWVWILSMIVGAILVSSHYELTLNYKKNFYQRAFFILGLRFGNKVNFDHIVRCKILKGSYTDLHMVGPFGITSHGDKFQSFLEFDNGDVVQTGSSKDRSKLIREINEFRFKLDFPFYDETDEIGEDDTLTTKLLKANKNNNRSKDLLILGIVSIVFSLGLLWDEWINEHGLYLGTIILTLASLVAIGIGSFGVIRTRKSNSH